MSRIGRYSSRQRQLWCCISFGLFGLALVEVSDIVIYDREPQPLCSISHRGLRCCIICGLFGWSFAKLAEFTEQRVVPIQTDTIAVVAEEEEELYYCSICMESKPLSQSFSMKLCSHSFCSLCVAQYVAAKVSENIATIQCPEPGCESGMVEPEMCKLILEPGVADRWGFLLCEGSIRAKFYCPFRDCSAVLADEREGNPTAVSESECPHCHRLFCAKCEVPWHSGLRCSEFGKLGEEERTTEDLKVAEMAKTHKWQRCPECKFYVERTKGCPLIKCRCGFKFCYVCGSKMDDHYCSKCFR